MSETTSRSEQGRGRSQAARTAMQEATQTVENAVHAAAESTNEFVGNAADTVSHTTDVAVNMTQRMADQGREAIWGGLRVAAGINGGLADVSYGNGHRILEQATRMMDIYGQTSERTTENLQALFAASLSLSRGAQQIQHTWLNLLDQSMNEAVRKPQDLFRCKSLAEVADVQRDLYVGAVDRALESSAALLRVCERVARDALGPLQNRPRTGVPG